jgi:osmotically-inducible protein OsmY
MTEPNEAAVVRPDVDIEDDINHIFSTLVSLRHDRPFVRFSVQDGVVTVEGNMQQAHTRRAFEQQISEVEGVQSIDMGKVYVDEVIRLAAGQATPLEVHTTVTHGNVILSGKVPAGLTVESLIERVQGIEGVRQVLPNFPKPKQD